MTATSLSAGVTNKSSGQRVHEFAFTLANFKYIQSRLFDVAGIELSDKKQPMVYSRLSRRLRAKDIANFDHYCQLIESNNSDELVHFINALTTNKTSFFRESHHFEYIKTQLLPLWQQENKSHISIWCAASSTGEEPYSIASLLNTYGNPNCQYQILASDLDTNVLAEAKQGIYDLEQAVDIPEAILKKSFFKGAGHQEGLMKAKQSLKAMLTFKHLNLNAQWPTMNQFDLIFCRNVFIYFNTQTQQQLISKFHQQLSPAGTLFLGHSENIGPMRDRFATVGRTTFLKQKIRAQ